MLRCGWSPRASLQSPVSSSPPQCEPGSLSAWAYLGESASLCRAKRKPLPPPLLASIVVKFISCCLRTRQHDHYRGRLSPTPPQAVARLSSLLGCSSPPWSMAIARQLRSMGYPPDRSGGGAQSSEIIPRGSWLIASERKKSWQRRIGQRIWRLQSRQRSPSSGALPRVAVRRILICFTRYQVL